YGEKVFKETEERVIARLLQDKEPHILSTGVEAFLSEASRSLIKEKAFSVWVEASVETIYPRVIRRDHRPQLKNSDKKATLKKYIKDFSPIYAEADFSVNCDDYAP